MSEFDIEKTIYTEGQQLPIISLLEGDEWRNGIRYCFIGTQQDLSSGAEFGFKIMYNPAINRQQLVIADEEGFHNVGYSDVAQTNLAKFLFI